MLDDKAMPRQAAHPSEVAMALALMASCVGCPKVAMGLALMASCVGCAAPTPPDLRVTHIRVAHSPANLEALQSVRGALVGGGRGHVDAYVHPGDLTRLRELSVRFEVLADDYRRGRPVHKGAYHDNADVEQTLQGLASAHPDLVRVVDVGTSRDGAPIVGVVITAEVRARKGKPAMRLLGTHHGDEWASMEVTLAVAEALARGYATDGNTTALLDEVEIWLVPVVNPDGLEAFTRGNARGVDLNRNYSYMWMSDSGGGRAAFSEPETDAVRALGLRRSFVQSLTYHSGAACCNYVWNHSYHDTPDEALARHMCQLYEGTTAAPGFWTTNGADWYVTYGDTNDWSYGVRGGLDYTLEVSRTKTPAAEEIPEYVGWHVQPTLAFLQTGQQTGVVGTVVDADTGVPLEARVTNGPQGWPVYADPDTGLFHRMLLPGAHRLEVAAPGYRSAQLELTVSAGAATRVDVQMTRATGSGPMLRAVEPSVLRRRAGRARVRLLGSGLVGWANDAELGRWDGDAHALPLIEDGGELFVDIDPADLAPEYSQEGFWWLGVNGDGGEVVLPRALLVVDGHKGGFGLTQVDVQNHGAGEGMHRVRLQGWGLPRGADFVLVGPNGATVVPHAIEREHGDEIVARVDGRAGLADGAWDVVVYGRAHFRAFDDGLQSHDGLFEAVGARVPGFVLGGEAALEPADPPEGYGHSGSSDDVRPQGVVLDPFRAAGAPAPTSVGGFCAAVGSTAQPSLAILVVTLGAVTGLRRRSRRR